MYSSYPLKKIVQSVSVQNLMPFDFFSNSIEFVSNLTDFEIFHSKCVFFLIPRCNAPILTVQCINCFDTFCSNPLRYESMASSNFGTLYVLSQNHSRYMVKNTADNTYFINHISGKSVYQRMFVVLCPYLYIFPND